MVRQRGPTRLLFSPGGRLISALGASTRLSRGRSRSPMRASTNSWSSSPTTPRWVGQPIAAPAVGGVGGGEGASRLAAKSATLAWLHAPGPAVATKQAECPVVGIGHVLAESLVDSVVGPWELLRVSSTVQLIGNASCCAHGLTARAEQPVSFYGPESQRRHQPDERINAGADEARGLSQPLVSAAVSAQLCQRSCALNECIVHCSP